MRGSSFGYLVKEGVKSVWLNRLMSFASVGVLTACLLLIGSALLFSENVNNFVGYMEEQNEFIAIIDDFPAEENQAKVDALKVQIEGIDNITACKYMSKEDVLAQEREKMGEDAIIYDGLDDDNPLPQQFVLKVADLSRLSETVENIQQMEGISQVIAADNVAQTLTSIKNVVQVFGIIIFVVLVLVSLVIISNTIRLTVFSRRKEINIMKYVGATNNFIRFPFIVEGFLLGSIAAALAFGLIALAYHFIISWLSADNIPLLQGMEILPFGSVAWELLIGFAAAGILTGVIGSIVSMRKHLKV